MGDILKGLVISMKTIYNIKTYNDLVRAIELSDGNDGTVINIIKDIVTKQAIEISGRRNLEITSENNSSLIGGEINVKWEADREYLTFKTDKEPRILIINGRAAKKSSFPSSGYLENIDVTDMEWINSRNGGWNRKPTKYELTHITVKPQDIPDELDINNCDIRVIHTWDESITAIKGYDESSGIITCENEMAHPAGAFGVHKYKLLNTKYGLWEKGTWCYDRMEKKIYYYPCDGENENNTKSMIPISESILRITDSDNIKISNLKILLSNAKPGEIAGLRAVNPCGAIHVERSHDVSFDMNEIAFSGGQGIKLIQSKNISVTNCIVESCASCGILTYECEDERIAYNVIKDIGLNDFSAVSIHAGGKSLLVYVLDGNPEECGQTVIEYNTIDGSPYCGITCSGGPHIIRGNKIIGCMQKLNDGGAIYCSRAKGTLIKDNYVSGINAESAYSYYLDELSENCIIDSNVSLDVKIPIKGHIAKNCVIKNNVLVNNGETVISLTRSTGFKSENNIIVGENDVNVDVSSYMPDEKFTVSECIEFCNDIFYSQKGKVLSGSGIDFDKCGISTKNPCLKTEQGGFITAERLNGIDNRYIVSKTEPHCIVTNVKPEKEEEYKELHSKIWDMIVKNGHLYNIRNYSIFKYKEYYISYFEYVGDNFERDMKNKALLPITKKWKKLCEECYTEIKEQPELIFFNRF